MGKNKIDEKNLLQYICKDDLTEELYNEIKEDILSKLDERTFGTKKYPNLSWDDAFVKTNVGLVDHIHSKLIDKFYDIITSKEESTKLEIERRLNRIDNMIKLQINQFIQVRMSSYRIKKIMDKEFNSEIRKRVNTILNGIKINYNKTVPIELDKDLENLMYITLKGLDIDINEVENVEKSQN